MYVTLQDPAVRVHVALLKVPVELVVKLTVPVGVPPEEDVTVAVQLVAAPTVTEAGVQLKLVLVDPATTSTKEPLLPANVASPL